jgi:hypothetical protein
MKNILIGSLVAAIIVFVYQAMSWMVLPIHENSMKYTPEQDAILAALARVPEDGLYALPNLPPGSTQEQRSEFDKSMVGKSWAVVHYHKSYGGMMTMQLVWGFLLNFVAAFLVAYTMQKASDKFSSFGSRLMLTFLFVLFTLFQSSLMMANWWGTPWHYLSGEITDHVIGWLLGGCWLAWWMGRKQTASA